MGFFDKILNKKEDTDQNINNTEALNLSLDDTNYFENSGKRFEASMMNSDDPAWDSYFKGRECFHKNDHKNAISFYKNAIRFNPEELFFHLNLAIAYSFLEEYDNAKSEYLNVIAKHPYDVKILNSLAIIYMQESNLGEAKKMLDRALQANPNFYVTHVNLSFYYRHVGDTSRAEFHKNRSIELDIRSKQVFDAR